MVPLVCSVIAHDVNEDLDQIIARKEADRKESSWAGEMRNVSLLVAIAPAWGLP
jgi:hypothetical protein